MSPSKIRSKIVNDKISLIRNMISHIRALPIESYERFNEKEIYGAAAESYLRRAIEALMDCGRHILAKGFAIAVGEYKIIAEKLLECGILDKETAMLYGKIAGYRNRMVHFYDEITKPELYHICTHQLTDIERIVEAILEWLRNHQDKMDTAL